MSDTNSPSAGEAATDALVALGKIKLPPAAAKDFSTLLGEVAMASVTIEALFDRNARMRRDLAAWEAFRQQVQRWQGDEANDSLHLCVLEAVLKMMPPAPLVTADANGGREGEVKAR